MINLYHLKYFCDSVRSKSLVKAAELNRVTHPAISQGIRSLELNLGVALLLHAKRKLQVTPQGMILFKNAENIFKQIEQTKNSLTDENKVLRGPLGIGCSHSLGLSFGKTMFPTFCLKHTEVDFSVRIGNSKTLETLLDTRAIEIGLGVDDGSFTRFEKILLKKGKFVLVVGLLKGSAANTYLIGDKGSEVFQLRNHVRGHTPPVRFIEVQSWELIAQMAMNGMGWGLVPDYLLKTNLFPKLRASKRTLALPAYEICAFFRATETLSAAAKGFLHTYKNDMS